MNRIVVLGGSGFVGQTLCEQLLTCEALAGATIVVPTRRRDRARHLGTLPTVQVIEASVHADDQLDRVLQGADVVVNLIAILHGTPASFEQAHVDFPKRLVAACQRLGVSRVVHVSALGVPDQPGMAPSNYLRSKATGEQVFKQSDLAVTVLRPSVIFGERDQFMNLFAQLQAMMPVMPLAGADARLQPVWVEDVAQAIVQAIVDPTTAGKTFECSGPAVYTLRELVSLAGTWSGHARPVLPVPALVGRLQAQILSFLPGEPLMSTDNLDSLKAPNVASGNLPGLAELGIQAASLEAKCPAYLGRGHSWADRLNTWRTWAGR